MLRILKLTLPLWVLISSLEATSSSGVTVTQKDLEKAKKSLAEVQQKVTESMKNEEFQKEIQEEKQRVGEIHVTSPEINLPELLEEQKLDYKSLMRAMKKVQKGEAKVQGDMSPMALVSFSMPELALKKLSYEAERIGAKLVLQGLYKDNYKETFDYVRSLGLKNSVVIDPMIFRRLAVTHVPVMIMPLEDFQRCEIEDCDLGKHVRASGSVSFEYFLEKVAEDSSVKAASLADAHLAKLRSTP